MKKLNRLIQGAEHKLGAIKQHAEKLNALTQRIRPLLPEEWRNACTVSSITESSITISTSEQASITLLRFMQPQLLRGIKMIPLLKNTREIHFVFAPDLSPLPPLYHQPHVSQEAIDACEEAISGAPKPLQKSLKKLIKTLQQNRDREETD